MGRSPRRHLPKLVLSAEALEARQMLSLGGVEHAAVIPISATTAANGVDQFAWNLAHDPRLARRLDLATLAGELKADQAHPAMASWGAALRAEMARHADYAANHRLTAMIAAKGNSASAWNLAHDPRLARRLGLATLAGELKADLAHPAMASWGAALRAEVARHPAYATHHHLAALIASLSPIAPAPGPSATGPLAVTMTNVAVSPAEPVTPAVPVAPVAPVTSPAPVAPIAPVTPTGPVATQPAPTSVAVGGVLRLKASDGGLSGPGLTYTITPQPLPENMIFNRQTGALKFSPAPGQQGSYQFGIAVSDGTHTARQTLAFTVTAPAVAATSISGRVVGQSGRPLAGIPVSVDAIATVTDSDGHFTLSGLPANPGPLKAGGAVGTAEGRQDLAAPVAQLLGRDPYADANNVLPSPLILPKIHWSPAAKVARPAAGQAADASNAAVPGFSLKLAGASAIGPHGGTLRVAELGPKVAAQHLPDGIAGPLLLYKTTGLDLTRPTVLSLPNTTGLQPGATVGLLMFNPKTGGKDVVGQLVVSADGKTVTSTTPVVLATAASALPAPKKSASRGGGSLEGGSETAKAHKAGHELAAESRRAESRRAESRQADNGGGSLRGGSGRKAGVTPAVVPLYSPSSSSSSSSSYSFSSSFSFSSSYSSFSTSSTSSSFSTSHTTTTTTYSTDKRFTACLGEQISQPVANQHTRCIPCEQAAAAAAAAGNNNPQGSSSTPVNSGAPQFNSDADLVSGEYFQDHQPVTYMSQGQDRGIDLQYSSGQAYPKPVVQAQFTTPINGDASSIRSITAQVSLAGVLQGAAVKYKTPTGLTDGETYDIPLQVDASSLPTGAYSYTMKVTEHFGQKKHKTSITTPIKGHVNVVNESVDAMGAGWSVGGLQHVSQASPGGPALITAGRQGAERFDLTYAAPARSATSVNFKDLAIASSSTADTSTPAQILTNDGTGSFTSGPQVSSGASTTVVGAAAGDFNGDDLPDLAVAGQGSLTIFTNDGAGGFSAGTPISLPVDTGLARARAIAVGNFSGHAGGVLDIAVLVGPLSGSGDSVVLYVGNGDGTFSSPVVSAAGITSSSGGYTLTTLTVADFNGDGLPDLAFTDNGAAEVMLSAGGGSFSSATSLALPSGHQAIGLTSADYNRDGKADLIVEASNTVVTEYGAPFVSLDLYSGSGSGSFTYVSTHLTTGHPDTSVLGLVAGDFNGAALGLEVAAVVAANGDGAPQYVDILPLSAAGAWSRGTLRPFGAQGAEGNIVEADFNGSGKPSIAVASFTPGGARLYLLLADPDSDQFLPFESVPIANTGYAGGVPALVVAPFGRHAAVPTFQGPTSDPSTLVHNVGGTWTRSYPDGMVIQFDSSGRETSEADRNGNTTTYAYVPTGLAGAGSLKTMTDPVGLVTTLAYDTSGHLASITDPAGRVTTFTVDSSDNLTEIVNPDGAVEQFGYSTPSSHLITTEVSPDGNTATAHYNSFGQLTGETLFNGTSTTGVVSAQGRGLLAPGSISFTLPLLYAGSVTDPLGRTTTIPFSLIGHPAGADDATGAVTTISYDDRGFPATETDPLGRTTTYTHDASGNVTSITLPAPGSIAPPGGGALGAAGSPTTETIAYDDAFSVPTAITDFDGNTTTFTLDSRGNVTRRTDPDGLHEDWTYNSAGQVLTDKTRAGNTTTIAYDAHGRVTTVTYPGTGSPHSSIHYDSAGDVTSVVDELGHAATYTYDPAGRVLSEQDPVQGAAGHATSYAYDADGNLLTVTDALGHATSYAYDARDEVTSMTDPVNQGTTHHTVYGYDASGNLVSETDPLGHATTFSYDNANREVGMTDAVGDRTTYAYDLAGEPISITDPNSHATTLIHDHRGQVRYIQLPALVNADGTTPGSGGGGLVGGGLGEGEGGGGGSGGGVPYYILAHDADGNLTSVTDPLGNATTMTYNSLNWETAVTDALGHATSYGHDADGNVSSVTDPLGHATTYAHDVRDRLVGQTEPSGGGTTSYTHDDAGNLLTVTDPVGNVTTYTYDSDNRTATETSPTGGVTTYTYDLANNLAQKVDPLGRIVQYGYDANDRETTEKWLPVGGGPAFYTMTMAYDVAGRVTSVVDPNSTYAYGYDNANRVATIDDAGTTGLPQVTLTYGYDGNGQRTSQADSLGGVVSYTYDARHELDQLSQSGTAGSGVASELARLDHDQAGNLTSIARYSNLAATSEAAATSYTYDSAERLATITHRTSGGSTIASYGYTLDAANRLTQLAKTWTTGTGSASDTVAYGYTGNNQLTSASHSNTSFAGETFSFDSNGNRNATGYSTTAGNRASSDGTYNYTYDADGNQVTKTSIATGVVLTDTWDYRNRLTQVQQVSGGVTTTVAQYTYDSMNRPIKVVEGGATRYTLYDGQTPLLDFNGSGTVTARYLSVPGAIDELLARQTSSGLAWYLDDREGSVGDIVNNSGTVIDHVDYGAFGNVLAESSPSSGDRFKYAGMELDGVTGLDYDRARYYDSLSGRFIGQDSTGFNAGDSNLFRYTLNDPTDLVDVNGLQAGDGQSNQLPPPGGRINEGPPQQGIGDATPPSAQVGPGTGGGNTPAPAPANPTPAKPGDGLKAPKPEPRPPLDPQDPTDNNTLKLLFRMREAKRVGGPGYTGPGFDDAHGAIELILADLYQQLVAANTIYSACKTTEQYENVVRLTFKYKFIYDRKDGFWPKPAKPLPLPPPPPAAPPGNPPAGGGRQPRPA